MPVVDRIRFPIRAVAVGMLAAAGCRNRTGFQYTVANGAFLMLRAVSGSRCRSVDDPVAGGMSSFLGLCATGAFMPVLVGASFPVSAVAVGMTQCSSDDVITFSTLLRCCLGCCCAGSMSRFVSRGIAA